VGGILAPAYAVLARTNAFTVHVWASSTECSPLLGSVLGVHRPGLHPLQLGHSYKQNLSVWQIISLYVRHDLASLSSLILTILIALPWHYQASKRNTT